MIKKSQLLSLVLAILFCLPGIAQEKDYKYFVEKADSLYELKEFKKAAELYVSGFSTIEGKAYPKDRYNLAKSFTQVKDYENALYHLNYLADKSIQYLDFEEMKNNPDLEVLHEKEEWKTFVDKLDQYKADLEKDYNWSLVKALNKVYEEDQGIRQEYFKLLELYDNDSPELEIFRKRWFRIDSLNQIAVTKIIDEYGWLGKEVVSPKGNMALFLVIQHAPLETQIKYLPIMREAVEKGKANAANLALMEDRVALRQGGKQIYGSQIGTNRETGEQYLLPLTDPRKVDERRESVGLGPITEYMSRFGLSWDVEEYLKKLPEYEALQQSSHHDH